MCLLINDSCSKQQVSMNQDVVQFLAGPRALGGHQALLWAAGHYIPRGINEVVGGERRGHCLDLHRGQFAAPAASLREKNR